MDLACLNNWDWQLLFFMETVILWRSFAEAVQRDGGGGVFPREDSGLPLQTWGEKATTIQIWRHGPSKCFLSWQTSPCTLCRSLLLDQGHKYIVVGLHCAFRVLCKALTLALVCQKAQVREAVMVWKHVAIILWKLATLDCYRSVNNKFGVGSIVIKIWKALITLL